MSSAADAARALWSLGDYATVARRLEPAAEAVAEALGVQPGDRLLDVAAGNGNLAIAAARRGARVTASDIAPAMIELGHPRTAELEVEWVEADAMALPFADTEFDRVGSTFGVMFVPDPQSAARELVRVTRPGGRIGVASWVGTGLQSALFDVIATHVGGGPRTGHSPEDWGDAETVSGWLRSAGAAAVRTERRTLSWEFDSVDDWLAFMSEGAPPLVAVRRGLGEERWPALREDLRTTIEQHSRTEGGRLIVEPEYLLAIAGVA